ncbi:MAG: hypothetical protein K1X74_19430 [Pirellulales bacterium]|nr:hypothetical protein [Pirellulales bacterium]
MRALFVTGDLMFSSHIVAQAKARGIAIELALSPAALREKFAAAPAAVVVLDLNTAAIDPAELAAWLRSQPQPPGAILAYAPHVHADRLAEARAAGCDQVLTRGQFHERGVDAIAAAFDRQA